MSVIEVWKKKMSDAGHQMASLQTKKGVYDIVAVTAKLQTMITIQYPKTAKSKGKSSVRIVQENIARKDIEKLRYYKND